MSDVEQALAQTPRVMRVASDGTQVELLVWGERGAPGLLLLHGAGAHAHWWDGVAPLLARDYRVASMSMPGNGGSDWRDRYASADIFEDARACVAAAGLDAAAPPVFVGHSFGGAVLMHGAIHAPQAMRALLLVDTSFKSVRGDGPPVARRYYQSEAEVLSRFKLMPPNPARESALVAHVARHAMMETRDESGARAWCWRADPAFFSKFEPGVERGPYAAPLDPKIPTTIFIAEHSHVAAAAATLPVSDRVARVMLPDCGHHVMLDRPLILVEALRAQLAVWEHP